jgi:hypothetical protein
MTCPRVSPAFAANSASSAAAGDGLLVSGDASSSNRLTATATAIAVSTSTTHQTPVRSGVCAIDFIE